MRLFVGTSGFSYTEWRGGFYPADLGEDKMLHYYAERLPSVELNNTFYRMPRAELIERWRAEVPEEFCFAVKAPRRITHIARLKNTGEELAYLDRVIGPLGARLGPILLQLPPFLKKDAPLLESFLAELPKRFRPAFEFRHTSWFDDEIYALLRAANAALVGGDVDEGPSPPLVATADFGYLRLRAASYDAAGLSDWSRRIAEQPWQAAYVYLKHEYLGPSYAKRLLDPNAPLPEAPPPVPEKVRAAKKKPAPENVPPPEKPVRARRRSRPEAEKAKGPTPRARNRALSCPESAGAYSAGAGEVSVASAAAVMRMP